jgi:hypothetical protein
VGAPCKLYLTYRSEYLVLRDLCVAVRDRGSGAWQPLHAAACAHLLGPVGAAETNPMPSTPGRVGERLCFYAVARRIVTGPIVAVEPATGGLLREADRQWQALFQPSDPRHSVITLAMER